MVKFSGMEKTGRLEDADYMPFIDASETDTEKQNKTVPIGDVRSYMMQAFQQAEDQRVANEKERQATEDVRKENEEKRQATELGYIDQAKKWATYSTDKDTYGSDTNNAHYWADQAAKSEGNIVTNGYAHIWVDKSNGHMYLFRTEKAKDKIDFAITDHKNLQLTLYA